MNLLTDVRQRAREAGRHLHDAAKGERRARQSFTDQRIGFDELRDAIRAAALAEQRALDLALVLTTLERLLEPPSPTRRDSRA